MLVDSLKAFSWRPDRRPIYEWARDNFTLPAGLTHTGKFDPTISRHFLAPLEALQNDRIREVNILASPRTGKTLIVDLFIPWMLANDPGSCIFMMATDPQARRHCENRLMPSLKRIAAIRDVLPTNRHQIRNTELKLSNDLFLNVCGTSIRNAQALGYKNVIGDEVWEWPEGMVQELKYRMGDFVKLANNKGIFLSQACEEGVQNQWEKQYHSAPICDWNVPCLNCGHLMPANWSGRRPDGKRWGIVYESDKNETGEYDIAQAQETVRFECRECGYKHTDSKRTRTQWNESGAYDRFIDSGNVSFHWNDQIDKPWSGLVKEWLEARMEAHRHSYVSLKQFFHKSQAEFASDRTVSEASHSIPRMDINIEKEWAEEQVRYMTVDVQMEEVLWVMIRAWGKRETGGQSRRLFWGKVQGWAEVAAIRDRFKVQPKCVFVDCGYERRDTFSRVINLGAWGVVGEDRKEQYVHELVNPATKQVEKRVHKPYSPVCFGEPDAGKLRTIGERCQFFKLHIPSLADALIGLIRSGRWFDPIRPEGDKEEAEYIAQMGAEGKVAVKNSDGKTEVKWHRFRHDNHATDCARYQVFAAMAAGLI